MTTVDNAVTQLVSLVNIDDNDAYLLVAGGNILYLYLHNKKDTREVHYGDQGHLFEGKPICNVQAALSNKFFMLGIPSKRAIGFFSLDRVQMNTKPLCWINKVSLHSRLSISFNPASWL